MAINETFNYTQNLVYDFLQSGNACLKVGGLYISDIDNFKYVVLLDSFNFILMIRLIF